MKITIDISDKIITDAIGDAGIGYWALVIVAPMEHADEVARIVAEFKRLDS